MAGRPRKPVNLHILQGTHRSDRHRQPDNLPVGDVKAPEWLTEAALQEWVRLAPMLEKLRVLTVADADALGQLCEAQAELKVGIASGRFNTDLWRAIMSMQSRFGLTPADRAKINVGPKKPETKLSGYMHAKQA